MSIYFTSLKEGEYYSTILPSLLGSGDKSARVVEILRRCYAPWAPKFLGDTLAERIVKDEDIVGKTLRIVLNKDKNDKIMLKKPPPEN